MNSNGRITGSVSINDIQQVIGVEDTDVTTICKNNNINPWARYKPIHCFLGAEHNVIRPLTNTERASENWGMNELIDNFTADDTLAIQDCVNSWYDSTNDSFNTFGNILVRPWTNGMYSRLSDFVKTNNNGEPVNNVGYNHNASLDTLTVTMNNTTYRMNPIINENDRTIYIPQGSTSAKFVLPDDSVWAREYYNYITGLQTNATINFDEESLNVLDLISGNTYGHIINGGKSGRLLMRGAAIFKWADRGDGYGNDSGVKWRMYNRTLFNFDNPNTYLDFTENSNTQVLITNNQQYALSQLEGQFLIVELWGAYYSTGYQIFTIPGNVYKINIVRSADTSGVNITDLVNFAGVEKVIGVDPDNPGDYELRLHYRAKATTALSTWYDVAMASINDGTDTYLDIILQRIPVVTAQADANGWYELYIASGPYAGTPTFELTVKQIGDVNTHSKTFTVI